MRQTLLSAELGCMCINCRSENGVGGIDGSEGRGQI